MYSSAPVEAEAEVEKVDEEVATRLRTSFVLALMRMRAPRAPNRGRGGGPRVSGSEAIVLVTRQYTHGPFTLSLHELS